MKTFKTGRTVFLKLKALGNPQTVIFNIPDSHLMADTCFGAWCLENEEQILLDLLLSKGVSNVRIWIKDVKNMTINNFISKLLI